MKERRDGSARLIEELGERGLRARVVPIGRLGDLREAIRFLRRDGTLDEEFYRERLAEVRFEPPGEMPGARSIIVVAMRDPQIRFVIEWQGRRVVAVAPPTFLHWRRKNEEVERILTELLRRQGLRVVESSAPRKLLAACGGLAEYGRNNVSYIEGMGSFYRLSSFYSDLECDQDPWSAPRMMKRCGKCVACIRRCPTGAIDPERFVIRAERCLTFHNERPARIPFPGWIDPSWQDCVVGCMRCQTACPENREVLNWCEDGGEYTEAETRLLLEGAPPADLPAALVRKLEDSDLIDLLDVLPRNLRAVLTRAR